GSNDRDDVIEVEGWRKRQLRQTHLPADRRVFLRSNQCEVRVECLTHSCRIQRADTVSGYGNIELYRWPVRDSTRSRKGSPAHPTFEFVNFQARVRQAQDTVTILQTDRQTIAAESRIHDFDLTLHVRSRAAAGTVDVEMKLTGACDVGIDHLTQREVDGSERHNRDRTISRRRKGALQLKIRAGSFNFGFLQGQHTAAVVDLDGLGSRKLNIVPIRQRE